MEPLGWRCWVEALTSPGSRAGLLAGTVEDAETKIDLLLASGVEEPTGGPDRGAPASARRALERPGFDEGLAWFRAARGGRGVQPGDWMQEGRLGCEGEGGPQPSEGPGCIHCGPSLTHVWEPRVCLQRSERVWTRGKEEAQRKRGCCLRPAAERGSRPLPGGQTVQSLQLPWARLRRVPG